MVDNPAHVKKLTLKQLERLAEELREEKYGWQDAAPSEIQPITENDISHFWLSWQR